MPKPLRIGVIGTGSIAAGAHLPAIAKLRGLLELVAVADVRPEVARFVGQTYGVDAYEDYRELLARDDVDLVDICTPEFLHAEQTIAAAEAGKHVHCEKPMASSVAEADAMIAACRRAGVRLMIGHSRRFTPRYIQIKAAIDAGEVGTVRFVRENERRPSAFTAAPPDPVAMWTAPGKSGALETVDQARRVHPRRGDDERGSRDGSDAVVRRLRAGCGLRREPDHRSRWRGAGFPDLHGAVREWSDVADRRSSTACRRTIPSTT